MGITTVLETEDGKPLATVEDPTNVLHRILPAVDDPNYQCLNCIDWYGDTVFNYLQGRQFVAEWEMLKPETGDAEAQKVFEAIRKLGQRLQKERHVYLKFYGD
jgi:hypothetical protein